ncbi:GNAT family N-acetyltransferase [Paracoccus tegillarcae]|uniref:N-acetyltransferase domain-containing protein n=1 Tax=Paracoccus tegillarcae TaxID=1529068 RepID=A0A2K9EQ73_9RHOB|nr:GNAT family N-acetyltransferase [Paracoccus tegillarcae]AUH32886.1 hypothetical protein CUV01_05320 [Paracoccus tegillarcae]
MQDQTKGNRTLLAVYGADLAGLICFGPAGHAALQPGGEIHHLHVAPTKGRSGIGRAVLTQALDELLEAGYDQASLAVVAENGTARRFHQAPGGAEAGRFTDPGPLSRSDNVIIRWPLR